jgi:secretion/DNA translocation related TadE-like protein
MRERCEEFPDQAREQTLPVSLWRLDQGFSVAVVLVSIAVLSLMLSGLGTAVGIASHQVQTQLAADTAALSAADTLLGAVAGFPCENAELITRSDGASLTSCRIVGHGAIVEVTKNFGIFKVSRWAEASASGSTK